MAIRSSRAVSSSSATRQRSPRHLSFRATPRALPARRVQFGDAPIQLRATSVTRRGAIRRRDVRADTHADRPQYLDHARRRQYQPAPCARPATGTPAPSPEPRRRARSAPSCRARPACLPVTPSPRGLRRAVASLLDDLIERIAMRAAIDGNGAQRGKPTREMAPTSVAFQNPRLLGNMVSSGISHADWCFSRTTQGCAGSFS